MDGCGSLSVASTSVGESSETVPPPLTMPSAVFIATSCPPKVMSSMCAYCSGSTTTVGSGRSSMRFRSPRVQAPRVHVMPESRSLQSIRSSA